MEVLIKNKAVETALEEIADAFRDNYPADYARFLQHVEAESQSLVKPSGMSEAGHFMNFLKIPCATAKSDGQIVSLYEAIKVIMRAHCGIDDFFRDRKNYDLLVKVWRDAEVRRRPRKLVELGSLEGTPNA